MSTIKSTSVDQPTPESDRFWLLDAAIVALAGLVLYLVLERVSFDDPNWLRNGWTYVVTIPLSAILLAIVSRLVVTRFVHSSLQIGLLSSVFVHLLMMILAINVVIFNTYFPDALTGVKQQRTPINRTIPEYIFEAANETASTPDWSKPVDAETTSQVVPQEKRQLPPVDHSAAKLEAPRPKSLDQRPMQKFLRKRTLPVESLPQPSDSPGRLARPDFHDRNRLAAWEPTQPRAPNLKPLQPARPTATERVDDASAVRSTASRDSTTATLPTPEPDPTKQTETPRPRRWQTDSSVSPIVESIPLKRPSPRSTKQRFLAAGASPSAASVAVKPSASSTPERTIDPVDAIPREKSPTDGADVMMEFRDDTSLAMDDRASIRPLATSLPTPNQPQTEDYPDIQVGNISRTPQSRSVRRSSANFDPAGTPISADVATKPANVTVGSDQVPAISDRLTDATDSRRSNRANQTGPTLDMLIDPGLAGLASRPRREAGIVPGDPIPEIASLELTPGLKKRRDLGGPVTPFGTKIAAVESFSRRIKRTEAGAAPTPAGAVGPATEEAIERGLQYLAGVQNDDGSWSLQGHGSDVVLRSDTAATGLCLLAFQGAGYTHRQHQYADTISRGLRFMLASQKTNGDLYRRENRISNENVALYSHGIAALALCEAYGMTQDPELRKPAAEAIRYIVETQHARRGGWRYTPQISADTSVTGWMMMALKSGQLAGIRVPQQTYAGIDHWLDRAQGENGRQDRYRYNPFAPNTPAQSHGRIPTPTMTAVGVLMRMYMGWSRDTEAMRSAADYLLEFPPQMGTRKSPQRDGYYWYYATMVMFHMGGDHWKTWNSYLKPVLLKSQISEGEMAGSWDPLRPVPDRWSPHAGRIYVTTMNLLNLEVYYRHLPIYDESAE